MTDPYQCQTYNAASKMIEMSKQDMLSYQNDPLLCQLDGLYDSLSLYISHKAFEITRDENLLTGLSALQEKINGLFEGHRVFVQVLSPKTSRSVNIHSSSSSFGPMSSWPTTSTLRFCNISNTEQPGDLNSVDRMEQKDIGTMPEEHKSLEETIAQLEKEIKLAIANLESELQELELI